MENTCRCIEFLGFVESRGSELAGEGQGEREGENLKQAPYPE